MAGWAAAVQAGMQLGTALLEHSTQSGVIGATKNSLNAQANAINSANMRADKLFSLYLQDTYPLEKDRNEAVRRLLPAMEEADRQSLLAGTEFSRNAREVAAPMQRELAREIQPDYARVRAKAKADVNQAFDEEATARALRRRRAGLSEAEPTAMAAEDQAGLARASAAALGQNTAAERERQTSIANQQRFIDSARMPGAGTLPPTAAGTTNAYVPYATSGSNVAGQLGLAALEGRSNAAVGEGVARGVNAGLEAIDAFGKPNTSVSGGMPAYYDNYSRMNAPDIRGV